MEAHVSPKRFLDFTGLYGVTSKNRVPFKLDLIGVLSAVTVKSR
jgi:hypothetical protein